MRGDGILICRHEYVFTVYSIQYTVYVYATLLLLMQRAVVILILNDWKGWGIGVGGGYTCCGGDILKLS